MASRTANRHRMRCGVEKCRRRWTLRKPLDQYKRAPKCPACGDTLKVRSVEAERRREPAKQARCFCASVPFPHRKGSILGCDSHPKPDDEWTEDDCLQYQAMLETPRSG